MPNKKIEIEGVYEKDKLDLSDNGKTEIWSGWKDRKVTWKIKTDEVVSFKLVRKTPVSPFKEDIPEHFDDKVELTVEKGHGYLDWEYAIHWKDENNEVHIFDPKIAVRPGIPILIPIIWGLAVSGLGFLTFHFFRMKNKR